MSVESIQITDQQEVRLEVVFIDTEGNQTPPQEGQEVTWTVSDPDLLEIEIEDDPVAAVIRSTGEVGQAQITVSLTNPDGDPDTDDAPMTVLTNIVVVPSRPVVAVIKAGVPRERSV